MPDEVLACDVLVAGGGVAGVSAALSASRRGCSVVLVDGNRQLGGIGTRGLLGTLCGLYLNADAAPCETLNKGIVREVVSCMQERAPGRTVRKTGRVFVLPYGDEDLAAVLGSLCERETGLRVLPETNIVSASASEGRIAEIGTEGANPVRIRPGVVIDATGSGELGYLAGASFELAPADLRQMSGYVVRVLGLASRDGLELKVPYVLADAGDGSASSTLRFTTFSPGDEPGEGFLKFNCVAPDGPDREFQIRTDAAVAMQVLKARLPAFSAATIAGTSGAIMDREGRRLRGEYVLSEEDVLSARKFTDAAVRSAWPIELWDPKKGTVYRYVPKGDYYEIPFRCLVMKGFANLLAAGRCISVSHEALGSVRVMGCCMATGDAAGRAAASFVKNGEYADYQLNA